MQENNPTFKFLGLRGFRLIDSTTNRQALWDTQSLVFLIFVSAFGLVSVLFIRPFLPEKYDFDSRTIEVLATQQISISDPNFQRVSSIYTYLGLGGKPQLSAVLGFLAVVFFLALILKESIRAFSSFRVLVIGGIIFICSVVFMGCYSKEFVLILFLIAFYLLCRSGNKVIAPFAVLFLYGYFFRSYWMVISVAWLLVALLVRRFSRLQNPRYVGVSALAVLFTFPIAANLAGLNLSALRFGLNEFRYGSEVATTAIFDFIPSSNPFLQILNGLLIAPTLLFPFPLLTQGNIIYMAFFVLIASTSIIFLRATSKLNSLSLESLLFAHLIAVVFGIQVFFEPDYGSYLRHLTPMLPLAMFVVIKGSKINVANEKLPGSSKSIRSPLQPKIGKI